MFSKTIAVCGLALLTACSSVSSMFGTAAQPLTQDQMQVNLQNALYLLKATGCVVQELGAEAAPIVSIAANSEGNQVLSVVSATGALVCNPVVVPPTAIPVPAPPNAPAATIPVVPVPAPAKATS